MALTGGGAVKNAQKVSVAGVVIANAGSTIFQYPMPNFQIGDPANCYVDCLWYRVTAGAMTALLAIFADVTGPNQITVVVNSPVAQALTLTIGGRVIELA